MASNIFDWLLYVKVLVFIKLYFIVSHYNLQDKY